MFTNPGQFLGFCANDMSVLVLGVGFAVILHDQFMVLTGFTVRLGMVAVAMPPS